MPSGGVTVFVREGDDPGVERGREGAARGGTVFECGASAKMDGVIVAVVHDEFRGMGLEEYKWV